MNSYLKKFKGQNEQLVPKATPTNMGSTGNIF